MFCNRFTGYRIKEKHSPSKALQKSLTYKTKWNTYNNSHSTRGAYRIPRSAV